jgi:hypothetical protein
VTLLPILYLKGVSTGDFSEALAALLAKDARAVTADLKFVKNHRFEIPMQGRSFFVRIAAGSPPAWASGSCARGVPGATMAAVTSLCRSTGDMAPRVVRGGPLRKVWPRLSVPKEFARTRIA